MEAISINGLDKSVANRVKKGDDCYLLKKGKYSVVRELEAMSIVYVTKNHFDVEQAISNPDSEIGKRVELSERTISIKGTMIIEREILDEIRVIIPKDIQMYEDSINDDEPGPERK